MASKKYLLFAGIFCLLASSGFSQRLGATYDIKDSSLIPSKRMAQHSEFLNGTYDFPAKPRDQWEIGVKAGLFRVIGDVPSMLSQGFGGHIRKSFGYVFSMRLEYINGIGRGFNWKKSSYYPNAVSPPAPNQGPPTQFPSPWSSNNYALSAPADRLIHHNYKAKTQDLSLQGVFTINNIRFHQARTKLLLNIFAGAGLTTYETWVNALNGNARYTFSGIPTVTYENRKDAIEAWKDMRDDTYESHAESHGSSRPSLGDGTVKPSGTFGVGVAYRLSSRMNLAIESRFTIIKDDLLDGQRWAEKGDLTSDFDSYNLTSLGLNFNLGKKSTEPLYWLNPLNYPYSEIRNPRLMRLPKPVLPDTDGDGVTDQFDQEQTPAGCPVDSHGVTRDTDGDGVPDCKDKELITPTYCQPVDADGVGKCPTPCPTCESCPELCKGKVESDCAAKIGSLPSVAFKANSNKLDDNAKAALSTAAARLRNNPGCKIVVIGYCSSNKKEQQLSWDHVNAVINYMIDKEGISADRFIFNYGVDGGDCNTVDLRAAAEGEDGPATIEPPHPNLRKN